MPKKIKAAILGFGGMGHCHASQYAEQKEVELVALCDIDPEKFKQDNVTINIGNSGKTDTKKLRHYLCYEELIKGEKDLDYIDICLPSYLHKEYAVRAMKDGFNVLCEKPMALNVKDCNTMVSVKDRTGKLLMIAQCLRFDACFQYVKHAFDTGKYGKLLRLDMRRNGGLPGGWFRDVKLSGGALMDLHLHDSDFINHVFGMPKSVIGYGVTVASGGIDDSITHYFYEDPSIPLINSEGSWARGSWNGAVAAIFEKGTLEIVGNEVKLYRPGSNKPAEKVKLSSDKNCYFNEIAYFAHCVAKHKQPELAMPESTRDSIRLIFAEEKSILKGKKVLL